MACLLSQLPPPLKQKLPSAVWSLVAKMMADKNNVAVRSAYGPMVVQAWRDSTFRLGAMGRYGYRLSKLLNERKTPFAFIDVGANMGIYSLVASDAPNCKRVFAIEPNPLVVENLQENIRINNAQVDVYACGIGEENGSIILNYRANHTGRGNLIGQGGEEVEVEIRNHTLFDTIAESIGDLPVLVKIDVEGYEAIVMHELASSVIANHVDGVFVEVTEDWVGEEGVKAIYENAEKLGLNSQDKHGTGWQYDVYFKQPSSR